MANAQQKGALKSASTPTMPKLIRLTHPHGYFDDHGRQYHWHAGDVISEAAEIAKLVARKALYEILE